MFENLTDKLQRVFKNLRGQGKLTQEHVDEALAGIREALLEGDVNVGVTDELLEHIRESARLRGVAATLTRSAGHQDRAR
jgi:signal recognition particle subunit SRP54